MKFSCTQENLNRGLAIVSHIANKNANLPILGNVLLEAGKAGIRLSATNLEIGISCLVRGKIDEVGKITIPARLFADYINLLPNEKIDFIVKDQELEVACQKSHTKIKGLAADEFPVIPKVDSKKTYQLTTKDVKKAISSTAFAVAFDESRPEISGVYTIFKEEKATLVATDSYRLAEAKADLIGDKKGEESVIVPVRTYQEIIRILEEENESIEVNLNENQIQFTLGDIELVSRVIDGQYPDYTQIIPAEHRTKAVINIADFTKAIKTAALFCKSGINDIDLKLDKEKATITTSNTQVGENESEIEINLEGEPNQIVFNYRYLLDGLANIDSEEVELRLVDSVNPGLLLPAGQEGYFYIIMPIKQ